MSLEALELQTEEKIEVFCDIWQWQNMKSKPGT